MLESVKTASLQTKIDVADKINQKDINSVDLGCGIKCDLKRLIDSKKVISMQVFQFKKEVLEFLTSLFSHAVEKSPFRSLLARCLKCLSPNFMVESSISCKLMFGKILEKLISYKQLPSREVDARKTFFSSFLSTTVKVNKDSLVKFDKETDHVSTFIW